MVMQIDETFGSAFPMNRVWHKGVAMPTSNSTNFSRAAVKD
ncbi:hypothetical protein BH09ACT10_BH09ACT10_11780 [soil metagenome]